MLPGGIDPSIATFLHRTLRKASRKTLNTEDTEDTEEKQKREKGMGVKTQVTVPHPPRQFLHWWIVRQLKVLTPDFSLCSSSVSTVSSVFSTKVLVR